MIKGIKGFSCPECGSKHTSVKDSRPIKIIGIDTVRRRRLCGDCGHRASTVEIPVQALDEAASRIPLTIHNKVVAERDALLSLYRSEVNGR